MKVKKDKYRMLICIKSKTVNIDKIVDGKMVAIKTIIK